MNYLPPITALAMSLLLVPAVRFCARKRGWIAVPSRERWHKTPTALMGGIGIFLSFAVPSAFLFTPARILERINGAGEAAARAPADILSVLLIGATFVFILGLVDDFLRIKPHTKLAGQIMAAAFAAFMGLRLGWFESMTLDTMVTMVWIVGVTNAFNLIDNMDGLCAGVGLIASLAMAGLFWHHRPDAAAAALTLGCAMAGFLVYNFKPATIFMGDCGSLVIGYSLSLLTLHFAQTTATTAVSAIFAPVLVLLAPIFDTTMVTFVRILSGRKASVGGRDHTSHRLVLMGLSERAAVLFLYGVAAVSGLAAIFTSRSDTFTSPAVLVPVGISVLLMGIYLAQLRVYPEKEFSVLRDKPYTPILVELTYKKQIVLLVLDFGLIAFSWYLSYRLRFDSDAFQFYFPVFLKSLPAIIAIKCAAFMAAGIYKGFWRFIGTDDVAAILRGSALASLAAIAAVTFIFRFQDFSKGIFVIDWFLTTGFILGVRGSFKYFTDTMKRKTASGQRVLIYGAGQGGEILLREILSNPGLSLNPAGFIDDDPLKTGKRLQGYPVLCNLDHAEKAVKESRAQGLIVSFRLADGSEKLETLRCFCAKHGLFLKRFSVRLEDISIAPDAGLHTDNPAIETQAIRRS